MPDPYRKRLDEFLFRALVSILVVYLLVTCLMYNSISRVEEMAYVVSGTSTSAVDSVARSAESEMDVLQHRFPIHVDEMEEIPHPGLALSTDTAKVPDDLPHTLQVPLFFDNAYGSAYGGGTIRQYLGDGDRLPTLQELLSIGSFVNGLETIYASVASYRDPECTLTVEDLYKRAAHPERIRVAIIDQRALHEDRKCADPPVPCDQDPTQALCQYRHLIDVMEVDARLAVGPVFARHLAHRHYRGEYFSMQVDSHVRFTEHWDEDIIEQWKSAHNHMCVLTTYLSDLSGAIDPITHQRVSPTRPIMCESDYEGNGLMKHLRHGQQPEGTPYIHNQPTLQPFWAAGFSFARGHFVIQVPYDQYQPMVFQGEEISIGLRGFTYGYDFYTPERGVCYHMYAVAENEAKRKNVPLFWENSNTYKGVGLKAMRRLNHIIGMQPPNDSDDWQRDEVHKYGLGKVRTTDKFFRTFGIHTETQTVEHNLCRFVGQPMMKEFLPALRPDGRGLDYDKITFEFKDPGNANE